MINTTKSKFMIQSGRDF